MKLIATAAFLALPSANAIYLACCKRENECPTDRTDAMGLGDASFRVCCYDGEKVHASEDELDQIPMCLEDIATEGGPSIALMALPVPEGAEVQEPDAATPELANAPDVATTLVATTAAEVPEEAAALTATPEATGNAEGTIENAPVAAATTSTTDICCRTLAAVQQLRTGPAQASVCPGNMFVIDGAMYKDGDSRYQVCCDADDRRASEFVDSALSACGDGTAQTPLDSNDAVDLVESIDAAPAESAGDAEAQGGPDVDANESNSANIMKNAAIIGMTLVGAVLQAAL